MKTYSNVLYAYESKVSLNGVVWWIDRVAPKAKSDLSLFWETKSDFNTRRPENDEHGPTATCSLIPRMRSHLMPWGPQTVEIVLFPKSIGSVHIKHRPPPFLFIYLFYLLLFGTLLFSISTFTHLFQNWKFIKKFNFFIIF